MVSHLAQAPATGQEYMQFAWQILADEICFPVSAVDQAHGGRVPRVGALLPGAGLESETFFGVILKEANKYMMLCTLPQTSRVDCVL